METLGWNQKQDFGVGLHTYTFSHTNTVELNQEMH